MGSFNPHAPGVLGVEWPGFLRQYLPLSPGVERGQTLVSTVNETIKAVAFPFASQIDRTYRFHALATVYEKGFETAVGDVVTNGIAVSNGSVIGATLSGGAADVPDALNTAGDNKRIYFPVDTIGALCDVQFATAGLFTGRRILRVQLETIVVLAGVALATENLHLQIVRLSDGKIQSFGDLEADPSGTSTIKRTGLGEINPMPPGANPDLVTERYPWSVADIVGFDGGAGARTVFRFINFYPPPISLYFVQLRVTHCVENRIAVGARRYGSSGPNGHAVGTNGPQALPQKLVDNTPFWSKVAGKSYSVLITSADGGGPFRGLPGGFDTVQFGPSGLMPTLDGFDVFPPHEGRQVPRSPTNEIAEAPADSRVSPAILFDSANNVSVDSMPFHARRSARVFNNLDVLQGIAQRCSGADCSYEFVRYWARKVGNITTPLFASIVGSTTTLTAAEFDALPEITADGFKLITKRFDVPATIANTGAVTLLAFETVGGDEANYWEILAMRHVGDTADAATYGGAGADLAVGADSATYTDSDAAVHIATEPPVVDTLNAVFQAYGRTPVTGCGEAPPGALPNFAYSALSWAASSSPFFDYYELQRSDSYDATWRTIAKVHGSGNTSFFDFEWRVGRTSSWRVRTCRTDGFCGPWSATASLANNPPAVPETYTQPGTLMFCSNVAPQMSVALPAVFGDPVEEFGFPEADAVTVERFFGRDYQAGFRPTERGGARFTRSLLVVPYDTAGLTDTSGDRAFHLLRDLAWADVPYVCVKDDLGNRWFATVRVPDGTYRRRPGVPGASTRPGVTIAQVEVVEATLEPFPAERNTF